MTEPRPTKAQRREEARAAAQRMREQQARTAKRQRTIAIGALVAGIAVLAVVVTVILGQSGRTALEDVVQPAGSTSSGAIPVGATGVAGTTDGSSEDAAVVSVYADYLCPWCAVFEEVGGPVLNELRESGEVIVEYHPVSVIDSDYSRRAVVAAALVADQEPGSFLVFNDLLFVNQPEDRVVGLTDAQIADLAREAGVREDVAATIEDGTYLRTADGEDGTFVPWATAATEQAAADLDRLATPTILVDGQVVDTEAYDWRQEGRLAEAIADLRN